MKIKKLGIFALSLIVLVAFAGCQPNNPGLNTRLSTQTRINNNGWPRDDIGTRNLIGQDTMFDNNIGMNNGLNNGFNNGMNDGLNNNFSTGLNNDFNNTGINNRLSTNVGNNSTNASELARRIGSLSEVSSATVVTSNNKAVVGLKLNNNQNLNTNLRQRVENLVKETNRNITNVAITTDSNLFTRIQNMSNNNNGGTGILNTIGNDIEDLFRSIMPNTNTNTLR